MSTAQHLARIRADERERAWAPRYVGNELAGTRQAAAHHRQTATLRRAEADHATDPDEQTRLHREAREADALVATLDEQILLLEEQDEAWIAHRLHTARTRAEADISRAVVAARNDEPEPRVTADEWLTVHYQSTADEDAHRPVTNDDIDDRPTEVRERPPTTVTTPSSPISATSPPPNPARPGRTVSASRTPTPAQPTSPGPAALFTRSTPATHGNNKLPTRNALHSSATGR